MVGSRFEKPTQIAYAPRVGRVSGSGAQWLRTLCLFNDGEQMLDLDKFKNFLEESGVFMDYVSIGKDGLNQMVIMPENEKWLVFFSEQGRRYDLKSHYSVEAACSDFWSRISSTPSSFEKPPYPFPPG